MTHHCRIIILRDSRIRRWHQRKIAARIDDGCDKCVHGGIARENSPYRIAAFALFNRLTTAAGKMPSAAILCSTAGTDRLGLLGRRRLWDLRSTRKAGLIAGLCPGHWRQVCVLEWGI